MTAAATTTTLPNYQAVVELAGKELTLGRTLQAIAVQLSGQFHDDLQRDVQNFAGHAVAQFSLARDHTPAVTAGLDRVSRDVVPKVDTIVSYLSPEAGSPVQVMYDLGKRIEQAYRDILMVPDNTSVWNQLGLLVMSGPGSDPSVVRELTDRLYAKNAMDILNDLWAHYEQAISDMAPLGTEQWLAPRAEP